MIIIPSQVSLICFQVNDFELYKALYKLVKEYVRKRDEENIYYELEETDESDEGEGAAYLSEEDLQVRRVAHALFAPCMSHHCSCRAYLRGQPAGS